MKREKLMARLKWLLAIAVVAALAPQMARAVEFGVGLKKEMTAVTPDLVAVAALEDFKLAVVFADGKRGVFDCGPYMNFEFMEELRDPAKFAKVFIESGMTSWLLDGADLAPVDIYHNCKPYGLSTSAQKLVRPGERRAQLVT